MQFFVKCDLPTYINTNGDLGLSMTRLSATVHDQKVRVAVTVSFLTSFHINAYRQGKHDLHHGSESSKTSIRIQNSLLRAFSHMRAFPAMRSNM